jgi:hypothetical protein
VARRSPDGKVAETVTFELARARDGVQLHIISKSTSGRVTTRTYTFSRADWHRLIGEEGRAQCQG